MPDPFQLFGDEDADEHAAAFPRLSRKQRQAEQPQEPPVDPKLIEWAKRENSRRPER